MSELPSLPTVSAPAMLWALHRIAYTADAQPFTSGRLAELKQPRAIGTLLRFLRLIGDDGRLAPDIQATRGNLLRFCSLLRERFKTICEEREWWNPQLEAEFGIAPLKEERLNELLCALPPVQRQETAARRNLLAGLRELHQFLVQGRDRDWVDRRLAELHKSRSPRRAESATAMNPPGPPARATALAPPPSSGDIDELLQRELGLHPTALTGSETFAFEFDENDEPRLVVQATFHPPLSTLTPRQLRCLANCIKLKAAAVTLSNR